MIEQFKKKSFWITGFVLFYILIVSSIYLITSSIETQNNKIDSTLHILGKSDFNTAVEIFNECNTRSGRFAKSHVYSISECVQEAINTGGSDTQRNKIKHIFINNM